MEESSLSNLQTRMRDFETRVAQWRESYQEYQQLLAAFRQEQKGFAYQMRLHDEKHGDLEDMRADLKRIRQEQAWKRKMYP